VEVQALSVVVVLDSKANIAKYKTGEKACKSCSEKVGLRSLNFDKFLFEQIVMRKMTNDALVHEILAIRLVIG
jgi:hypothetical protein